MTFHSNPSAPPLRYDMETGLPIPNMEYVWGEDIDIYVDGVQLESSQFIASVTSGVFTVNLPYTEPSSGIRNVTIYYKQPEHHSHGAESHHKQVLAIQNGTTTVHFGYPVGFGDTYTYDKETGLPEISAHAGREKGEQEFEL